MDGNTNHRIYKYNWVYQLIINGSKNFKLLPLQFANADRIEKNNAVFIFDEVGCGKTISAGIMALHYLYNNPGKTVHIITTNSSVRPPQKKEYGQFLDTWYEKLPPLEKYKKNIAISNNVYSNIGKISDVGLLIIDEAHLFLEQYNTTKRTTNLKNIHAEKVIFLTATPTKYISKAEFLSYDTIAQEILGTEHFIDFTRHIPIPICSNFDTTCPITRYFKDTVNYLQYDNNNVKQPNIIRNPPILWQYHSAPEISKKNINNNRITALVDNIKKVLRDKDNRKNKFIIFTRYIDSESKEIFDRLINDSSKEFIKWPENPESPNSESSKFTVVDVNGSSYNKPELFSNKEDINLPDIMIVTYQIAEQGLNFQGYNYVINYHIPASPDSLEQRFGRVDRLDPSKKDSIKNIYMIFLISKEGYDRYTKNFWLAETIYMYDLIYNLPVRNVLLTEEILKMYEKYRLDLNGIKDMLNQDEILKKVFENLQEEVITDDEEVITDDDLTRFCIDSGIFSTRQETIHDFKKRISSRLELYESKARYCYEHLNEIKEILKKINYNSNKIFYNVKEYHWPPNLDRQSENYVVLDPINDCGKIIENSANYNDFCKKLNNILSTYSILHKYIDLFEKKFEDVFLNGKGEDSNKFLVPDECTKFLKECIESVSEISSSEKEELNNHLEDILEILPFFKMKRKFEEIIDDLRYTKEGSARLRYDFHLPLYALINLYNSGYMPENLKNELDSNYSKYSNKFYYYYREFSTREEPYFDCSNWFKLFYCCADKTSLRFFKLQRICILYQNCLKDIDIEQNVILERYICEYMLYILEDKPALSFCDIFLRDDYTLRARYRWKDRFPLPYNDDATPIWWFPSESAKKVDFWTYMIFSNLRIGRFSPFRGGSFRDKELFTITIQWWKKFISDRIGPNFLELLEDNFWEDISGKDISGKDVIEYNKVKKKWDSLRD